MIELKAADISALVCFMMPFTKVPRGNDNFNLYSLSISIVWNIPFFCLLGTPTSLHLPSSGSHENPIIAKMGKVN